MKNVYILRIMACLGVILVLAFPPVKAPETDCGPGECKPDLIPVWDVEGICPYSYDQRAQIVYFKIKNIGNANAYGFYTLIGSNLNAKYVYLSSLGIGQTVRLYARLTLGEYDQYLESRADAYNDVNEWNENNNYMRSYIWCE